MVVCKYFLQGTCKFDNYCHYEHQVPSNYTSFSDNTPHTQSILRQSTFSSAQSQNVKVTGTSGNVDINTLVKSVVNDMTGAEKGGQWLLSCYAPFKEKPAFPGFEDHSSEEIRLGFYEAQKNGSIEQYKSQLQTLLQNSVMKIRALQNPAPDVVSMLQNIYNTPPSNSSGTYGQNPMTERGSNLTQHNVFAQNKSPFGQTNENIFQKSSQSNATSPIFVGGSQNTFTSTFNQGQTNLFANAPLSPPQNQNIFSKTQTSIFGNSSGNNIFGGANPNQTANSTTSIFGSQPPQVAAQQSVFSGTQPTQQSTNIFGSTVPTSQNQTLFSSQNTNQHSIFGHQQSPQQNVFASQNQPQPIQTQTIFPPQNQQNMFSTNTNNTSPFPNPQPIPTPVQSTPPNYSASIFGYSAANTNAGISFGSTVQQPIDENVYSKLEELTDEERKWFESDTLEIMNIPDKPPTYDMCFKV